MENPTSSQDTFWQDVLSEFHEIHEQNWNILNQTRSLGTSILNHLRDSDHEKQEMKIRIDEKDIEIQRLIERLNIQKTKIHSIFEENDEWEKEQENRIKKLETQISQQKIQIEQLTKEIYSLRLKTSE